MSDESNSVTKDFSLWAVNDFYKACFKALVKRGDQEANEQEVQAINRCHSRLLNSFKIIHPFILKSIDIPEAKAAGEDGGDDE